MWRRLEARFAAGDRVLELACGTGEDAVFLARHGVQVLATDAAAEMVAAARAKADRAGVGPRVETRRLAFAELAELEPPGCGFDGVLSDFGGLNCAADLDAVAAELARLVRPGGMVVACVMGPLVPWEWLWFLTRGRLRQAVRRLRPGGADWRGVQVRYPSLGRLERAFAPAFERRRAAALGALLPPPYAEEWARRHPRPVAALGRWERRRETWPPFVRLADHYLVELERAGGGGGAGR